MRTNNSESFEKYYSYMQSVIPTLLDAENTIRTIKKSPEWKRAFNYFQCLYTRGQLKERPTSKNGYKMERADNLVRLTDIESILTPEQLEQIKGKTFSM